MVGVEAMRHGTPVVGSEVGGIGEWLHHGVNGYRVRRGDPEALADATLRILGDARRADRLGEGARNSVTAFSAETQARELAHLYEEALEESA